MSKIKHICAFRFHDAVDESTREQMLNELKTFPQKYQTMRRWTFDTNISQRDDRFSHAFVVEFDEEDDLLAYLNSISHEEFVKERFRPNVRERAIITLRSCE